jgi:quercetin dioxygenase-like cupin family protein
MSNNPVAPYALQAGQGWAYNFDFLGLDFVVKVGEQAQGRRLAIFEYTTRAGEEPPDHTHATEDEIFYVLQGAVAFRCGDDRFEVADGGCVFLPRGIEHGYQVNSDGDVKLLTVTAPAPDDEMRGWDGFVGRFERGCELRESPRGTGDGWRTASPAILDPGNSSTASRSPWHSGTSWMTSIW